MVPMKRSRRWRRRSNGYTELTALVIVNVKVISFPDDSELNCTYCTVKPRPRRIPQGSPSSGSLSSCPFVRNDHRRMTISASEDFSIIKIHWVWCLFYCVTKTHTVAAGLGALSVSTRIQASKGCGLKFFSEQRSGRRRAPPHNPIIHRPRSVKCKPACASPAGQRQAELFICAKG